jgi:DNA-binding transcriptional MocR family regulator
MPKLALALPERRRLELRRLPRGPGPAPLDLGGRARHLAAGLSLGEERRQAIVAVARRHNVVIIEDDVYRPLLDDRLPSLASLEPEQTVHISGLSKCVAPGLRFGFAVGPRALIGHVAGALRIDCWSISPVTALIGAIFLEEASPPS